MQSDHLLIVMTLPCNSIGIKIIMQYTTEIKRPSLGVL